MININERILCFLYNTEYEDGDEVVRKLEKEVPNNESGVFYLKSLVIPMIIIANLAYIFQLYLEVKNNGFVIFKKFKRWIPVIVILTTF